MTEHDLHDQTADDETLLAELRTALDVHDPVPDHARLAAHTLLGWRDLDTELAELQFDSALDAAGVRGLAWPRQLSFETARASIEVEIDDRRLIGQVVPPAEIEVSLTSSTGEVVSTRSDVVGHFQFDQVTPGPVRVRAELTDGSVTTQWFTL